MLDSPNRPPGSILAIAIGCTCPMIENNHGAGLLTEQGWGFIIHSGCPVHSHSLNLKEKVIATDKKPLNENNKTVVQK